MAGRANEFTYTSNDFFRDVPSGNRTNLSRFDITLRSLWDKALEDGMFNYKLGDIETKILPGVKSYVLQRNVERGMLRRAPQHITSMNQPFNPNGFNFKKIKEGEILMTLKKKENIYSGESNKESCKREEIGDVGRNLVIINVSPLEYGHILLVPNVDKGIPQRMDINSIKLALEMLLLSSHPGFHLGFNSLCALASVNHQHVHAYYTEFETYAEYVNAERISKDSLVYELKGMPCYGFGFQLWDSNVDTMANTVAKCVKYFQEKEIAHNIFFTRGVRFGEHQSSKERTVRILLYPREHYIGAKSESMFNTAVVELSGHIVVTLFDGYDNASEKDIDEQISSVSLSKEEFSVIKNDFMQILNGH